MARYVTTLLIAALLVLGSAASLVLTALDRARHALHAAGL